MKLILLSLILSLPLRAGFEKDKVGADFIHQEDDASLVGPTIPVDKSNVEKPAIQREEERDAAMPDQSSPTEDEQKEKLESEQNL